MDLKNIYKTAEAVYFDIFLTFLTYSYCSWTLEEQRERMNTKEQNS